MFVRFAHKKRQEMKADGSPLLVEKTPQVILDYMQAHNSEECYCTYMSYVEPDQENSSIAAPLVFDVDSESDVELARKETVEIYNFLKAAFDIDPDIYFSGKKGFHLIIPFEVFDIEPRFCLIEVYREIAKKLKVLTLSKCLDFSIYERKRIFRLPNSKHGDTGLYKIQLTYEELKKGMDEIKKLAVSPRVFPESVFKKNEKFQEGYLRTESAYQEKQRKVNEYLPKSTGDIKLLPCIQRLLKEGAPGGQRNNSAYTLALFFKSQGVPEEEANELLKGFSGLGDQEVQRTTSSAYKSNNTFGCNDNELVQPYCDKLKCKFGYQKIGLTDMVENFESLIVRVEENILEQKNISNITLGHEEFSKFGKLKKEELIVVVGDAGIGKTAYSMFFLRKNLEKGNRIFYCSLEMSNEMLLERTINEMTGMDNDNLAKNKGVLKEQLDFYRQHKHLIMFLKEGGLTAKNLKNVLDENMSGSLGIDAIVIDHLGGITVNASKSQYEEFSKILGELRSMVKKYKVPIMLLTHFNKGQRDASTRPRSVNDILGSGRVRDLSTKIIQIWYPREEVSAELQKATKGIEKLEKGSTQFLCQKNTYGKEGCIFLTYNNGLYT